MNSEEEVFVIDSEEMAGRPSTHQNSYPIDPVGGHMLYPGILAMQV